MVELPRKEVFETSAEADAKINDIPSISQEKPAPLSEDVAARIRDQALEEAARIADQVAAGRDDMLQGLAALGALIAEGIRSLKQCEECTFWVDCAQPATSQCEAADPTSSQRCAEKKGNWKRQAVSATDGAWNL